MIEHYRRDFNERFTPGKYSRFLAELERRSGAPVKFRCSETPCFFPRGLLEEMVQAGEELVQQLTANPEYLRAADAMIPSGYAVPAASDRPLFVQADFGIVQDSSGEWAPRLVEIQGFPSLYSFQTTLAQTYRDVYELPRELLTFLGALDQAEYTEILRDAVVGGHDPAEVVLAEVDPLEQKTLPDFLETERMIGVKTVDIRAIKKRGNRLFYLRDGRDVPIRRIYNRAIADELIRKQVSLDFQFTDDLNVEWAGNPNWYFRISKFSLPWLNHRTVPKTWFLSEVSDLPMPPERLVLKPMFSFAGLGVVIGPTQEEVTGIPTEQRGEYILQERMDFAATIHTPPGPTKAEVRIMYVWADRLRPVNTIIRTGRGKMMGVDHNRELAWVGASAGFFPV